MREKRAVSEEIRSKYKQRLSGLSIHCQQQPEDLRAAEVRRAAWTEGQMHEGGLMKCRTEQQGAGRSTKEAQAGTGDLDHLAVMRPWLRCLDLLLPAAEGQGWGADSEPSALPFGWPLR